MLERVPLEELANQMYEKACELGLETLHVRTFESRQICEMTGSVAHFGYEYHDRIKLKFCHSGDYTLVIVRKKHQEYPDSDKISFFHKGVIIASDLVEALIRVKNKMTHSE